MNLFIQGAWNFKNLPHQVDVTDLNDGYKFYKVEVWVLDFNGFVA